MTKGRPGVGAGQENGPFKDGGLVDRTGLSAWRKRRSLCGKGVPPALIHLIQRSSNFSGADDVEATGGRSLLASIFEQYVLPVPWRVFHAR